MNSPTRIALRMRHIKWLNAYRNGKRQIDIAAEAGVAKSTVCEAIRNLMLELPREDAEAVRALQVDRLNRALEIAFTIAEAAPEESDTRLRAIDRIVRIEKRRSEILGTDEPQKAPVGPDGQVVPSFVVVPGQIPESVTDWLAQYGGAARGDSA